MASPAAAGATSDLGDGFGVYCQPLTNMTDPGNQNRDTVSTVYPSSTNPGQFPSIVDQARVAQTTGGDIHPELLYRHHSLSVLM